MQKNAYGYGVAWWRHRNLYQNLLVMKFTLVLLTAFLLDASAKSTAQTVTYSGKNVSLERIFSDVEKQTGYFVLYTDKTLEGSKVVTVSVKDMPLRDFLDVIFQRQLLKYTIASKTITVSVLEPAPVVPYVSSVGVADTKIAIVVNDPSGKPLPGASISIPAKRIAGVTDSKGTLNMNVEAGDVLVISYVGYTPKTVKITSAMIATNILAVSLTPAATTLSDVQVVNTGYQRIRPEQSTGAVSQITTKEYESRVSSNFLDGLVNRLPGLMINNDVAFQSTLADGTRSSRSLFNIRGISTMSANQNPLIVVDGYPTELTLDMIDPNEIKSVSILKDAAAATIYGVRASNGVIVIERKQAVQGKPRFSFRATVAVTPHENYDRYRWDDSASAIVGTYQKIQNVPNESAWGQLFTGTSLGGTTAKSQVYLIQAQLAAKMITPEQAAASMSALQSYDNADDYTRLFLRNAVTQTYNLNVSGGNANALYYVTAGHTRNRLSQINNDNNRTSLSARTTLKLAKKLSLELTTDYQEQNLNAAPVPALTDFSPYEHFQDVNGNPAYSVNSSIPYTYNNVIVSQGLYSQLVYPLIDVNEISTKTKTINNKITANFNYTIGKGFDLSFGGIYETSRSDSRYLASELSSVARKYVNAYVQLNTDGTIKFNLPKGGYLNQRAVSTSSYTARAQLNYNKKLGSQHSINAILGAEVRNLINKGSLATYFGYNDGTLLQQPADLASISTGAIKSSFGFSSVFQGSAQYKSLFDQQYAEDRFLSGYTNIVYSFKNTYSLTGSVRVDQSNLFGTNPKYKYKPLWSLGAAWNIHKENFMQDVAWVKVLKLRGAYGFNGNVAKMSLPEVIASAATNLYTSPASPSLGLFSYANSSLRWEQTKNQNIGLDYTIFRNISGTVDYYQKNSIDLMGNSQIDPTIGTSPSLINKATISNKGIEISLHADWISRKNFNWNTGLVLARNTSNVHAVYQKVEYNPQTLNVVGYVKDLPVGAMFAYRYAGLDSAGYPRVQNEKGQYYYTNLATSTSPIGYAMKSDTSNIVRYMGSSIPTINAGLSNRFDIGNFYVFCMINYYGGFKVRVPRPVANTTRPQEGAGTYWKAKGDENITDVMTLAGYANYNANSVYNYADKYVVNGDYITLGDLTLSYSFDNTPFVKRSGFTHFEVKGQASNIMTFGLNKYNYSMATGSYVKGYITPTYTLAVFTNF